MTDELDDKELDKRIAALVGGRSTRKRGRPPTGFAKAIGYADEVWRLRWEGMSPWRAKKEVAGVNRKTPEHISSCVKMIDDTPGHEFWEHDETEDTN